MTELFGRVAKVTAYRARAGTPGGFVANNPGFFDHLPNGIEFTRGRIQASVEKHVDKEPNTCKITLFNCNDQTRTFLTQKPVTVRLEAGYDNVLRLLFVGDIRTCYSEFKNATIMTHIELADGDRAFRYAQVGKAYRKGTAVLTAVKDCAAQLGLKLDARTLGSPELQAQFAAGRTLTGHVRDELTALLAPYGFNWSIQDGRLQVLKDNQTRQDEAFLISEVSGMVESPTFKTPDKPGKPTLIEVNHKLYPQLTPGVKFVIRSRDIRDGAYRLEKITHELDTREGPFNSKLEGKSL